MQPTIRASCPDDFENQGVEKRRHLNRIIQSERLLLFVKFTIINYPAEFVVMVKEERSFKRCYDLQRF